MTMFNPDEWIRDTLGGGSATRRPLEGYSESELRLKWRAGQITDAEWEAELVGRGATPQQAKEQVAIQKNTGVSTAAATRGQLTPGEAAAVEAIRAAAPPPPPAAAAPGATPGAAIFNQPTTMPTSLASRMQQARAVGMNPLRPADEAIGPAGRTVDQIRGTEYLSEAERQWYLAQIGSTPSPSPSTPMSSAAASGGSGGKSAGGVSTSAASAVPKPPLPNSREDLISRGAVQVGTTPVLEGQQYRRVNGVIQAADGSWYIVDPQMQPVSGPYPNQTQASAANVYSDIGAAVTTNPYASLGSMAAMGAARPRISAGSGMDATASIDDVIGATHSRNDMRGDFLGSIQPFQSGLGKPLDVVRGAIPDYGGLRDVSDAYGNIQSFTGRTTNDLGQEIAIGTGNTSAQDLLFQGLKASDVAKMSPEKMTQAQQAISAMRQAGTMPDLGALASQWGYSLNDAGSPVDVSSSVYTPFEQEYAKVMKAIGQDPYAVDTLPETYATGGSMTVREPSVIRGLRSGRDYGVLGAAPERVTIQPMGSQAQQRQANTYEQSIARNLGQRVVQPMGGMIRQDPAMAPLRHSPDDPVVTRPAEIPPYLANMGGAYGEDDSNVYVDTPMGRRLAAQPRYNPDGSFAGWTRFLQRPAPLRDVDPANGIPDIYERVGRDNRYGGIGDGGNGYSMSQPVPRVMAYGGEVVSMPTPPTAFAAIMESLFPMRSKTRKPQYQMG